MNILIENAETLEYFTEQGQWSKKLTAAKRFGNTHSAFAAAKQELIQKFNIVSYFPQTRQFVNLDHGKGKGVAVETPA